MLELGRRTPFSEGFREKGRDRPSSTRGHSSVARLGTYRRSALPVSVTKDIPDFGQALDRAEEALEYLLVNDRLVVRRIDSERQCSPLVENR